MTKASSSLLAVVFLISLLIAGCSGGGSSRSGGGSTTTPPPPSNTGPTWTSGVYEAASLYKNRCQVVRTGVDIEGDPFPDMAGSTLQENFWLRSWTHETYLWNDEVVDRNPANYADRLAYFDVLRTTATTSSGKPKDDFHFNQPTDEYLRQKNSAPSASYGARLIAFSVTVPRDYLVQYNEPGSPAADKVGGLENLPRGAKILEVDGVDLVNAAGQANINALNAGLFPATAGEMHTFKIQDAGASTPRTVMLTSANIAPKPVNRMKVIDTPAGKVGYILLNTFSPFVSEKDIAEAMTAMKTAGVSDLVLDLRYNGGGLLAVASELGYMVAGPAQTNGKIYERLEFNADAGNFDPVTGQVNTPEPFHDTALGFSLPDGTPLDSLDLPRVFILSTDNTCSASESVINDLRGVDVEVILIGGTTCGKPYGFYPQDNCGETYFTIQFRGVNDKGFGDYADGFIAANSNAPDGVRIPGCAVNDDYDHELGDTTEALLAAALQYRENGSCPTPPPVSQAPPAAAALSFEPGSATKAPSLGVMQTNRDMTMPN